MGAPGTGTASTTFVATETDTHTKTRVATKTQQVAHYLAEDLDSFVEQTNLDLARWLGIPRDQYVGGVNYLVDLLFDDVERMLRERLITGLHLILSEPEPDKNTHMYTMRYHAHYTIAIPERSLVNDILPEYGGRLKPPKELAPGARFVLMIDWDPRADTKKIKEAKPPDYFFHWEPLNQRYDANSLVRFREGRLGTEVVRIESAAPRHIPH